MVWIREKAARLRPQLGATKNGFDVPVMLDGMVCRIRGYFRTTLTDNHVDAGGVTERCCGYRHRLPVIWEDAILWVVLDGVIDAGGVVLCAWRDVRTYRQEIYFLECRCMYVWHLNAKV